MKEIEKKTNITKIIKKIIKSEKRSVYDLERTMGYTRNALSQKLYVGALPAATIVAILNEVGYKLVITKKETRMSPLDYEVKPLDELENENDDFEKTTAESLISLPTNKLHEILNDDRASESTKNFINSLLLFRDINSDK